MNAYLSKPAQLDDLRAALVRALSHGPDTPPQAPAPAPPPRSAPLIDWNAIAALESALGQDAQETKRVVLRFWREDLGRQVAGLDTALGSGERARIMASANDIAGGGRQLGALALAALCDALEQQAAAGAPADLARLGEQINATYTQSLGLIVASYP
jgi:HPt (histidine-containing phosphotransfer) domain-containing protein